MVDEIADLGASSVALVTSWRQRTVQSTSITPGDVTVDDRVLRAAITAARRRGLHTIVFPILLIDRTEDGQWRGSIEPKNVARWWLSYERYILHYAAIASDEGADALIVGTEMSSTESWRDRWFHLIGKAERAFSGTLVYSANWDHYRSVSFWSRVDVVGITGYQPLTESRSASAKQMYRSWNRARVELEAFAAEQNKPLWLTEVGYTNVDGTATEPWNYSRSGRRDDEEQRRAYAAFAAAWKDSKTLEGALFWNWSDPAYTVKDRSAVSVVRQWFRL